MTEKKTQKTVESPEKDEGQDKTPEKNKNNSGGLIPTLGFTLAFVVFVGSWQWWLPYFFQSSGDDTLTMPLGTKDPEVFSEVTLPSPSLKAPEENPQEIEVSFKDVSASQTPASPASTSFDKLEESLENKKSLEALKRRLDSLETALKQSHEQLQNKLALMAVFSTLRRALERSAPYQEVLSSFKELFQDPEAEGMIQHLEAYAPYGVPTAFQLKYEFKMLWKKGHKRETGYSGHVSPEPSEKEGVVERVLRHLRTLVHFEKTDKKMKPHESGFLRSLKPLVMRGDFSTVIAKLEEKEENLDKSHQAWLAHAKARVDVERILRILEERVLKSQN